MSKTEEHPASEVKSYLGEVAETEWDRKIRPLLQRGEEWKTNLHKNGITDVNDKVSKTVAQYAADLRAIGKYAKVDVRPDLAFDVHGNRLLDYVAIIVTPYPRATKP